MYYTELKKMHKIRNTCVTFADISCRKSFLVQTRLSPKTMEANISYWQENVFTNRVWNLEIGSMCLFPLRWSVLLLLLKPAVELYAINQTNSHLFNYVYTSCKIFVKGYYEDRLANTGINLKKTGSFICRENVHIFKVDCSNYIASLSFTKTNLFFFYVNPACSQPINNASLLNFATKENISCFIYLPAVWVGALC